MPGSEFLKLHRMMPAVLVAVVAWWACGLVIKPYVERETQDRDAIAGLRAQIAVMAAEAHEIQKIESDARALRLEMDRLEGEVPGPSVQALLPEELKKHFAALGRSAPTVRMGSVQEAAGLPGYHRGFWSVALPLLETEQSGAGVALAAAELERRQPFVNVLDFAVQPDSEDPARRVAVLKLMTLFRN